MAIGFEKGGTLALNPTPAFGFTSAANPVLLPKAKPWALREHFVVSSIRSCEVARAQGSGVRHCEDALKALDFGNSLLGVHSVSISNIRVAIVNGAASAHFHSCPLQPFSREDQSIWWW